MDVGMEGVGEVVSMGESGCEPFQCGSAVGYVSSGSFSEYILISAKDVIPLPGLKAEYVSLLISGLTASVSLEKVSTVDSSLPRWSQKCS
jgi:NADPH:quinone reductase-like Zn-dependent oxidoreductase